MNRLIAVLALASGCASLEDPENLNTAESAVACPDGECGMNTDHMGAHFNELKLNVANAEGFTLKKFVHPLYPLVDRLEVFGDKFFPVDVNGQIVTFTTPLDTVLVLEDAEGVTWNIKITAVHNNAQYWATTFPAWMTIQTYELKYQQLDAEGDPLARYVPFCRFEPLAGHPAVTSDAVAFEGERYVADSKKILSDPEGSGWFNLACLGSAPAKMLMMRHAKASSDPPAVQTSLNQRRALLNAWTANYCGDGRAFTKAGTPIGMRDSKGWIDTTSGWSWPNFFFWFLRPFDSYEAAWGPDGAICLDTPRRDKRETIDEHCWTTRQKIIPACTNGDQKLASWPAGTHILTVNP